MKKTIFEIFILFLFLFLLTPPAKSQQIPQGFHYQTSVRNSSGNLILTQLVNLKFSLFSNSPTGILQWQETHLISTNNDGLVTLVIGNGTSTGLGATASFTQIDWNSGIYYLAVSIDISGGNNFSSLGTTQLFSVPYALQSFTTNSIINFPSLNQFQDVTLNGIAPAKILKWNGNKWYVGIDNDKDTVTFANTSSHSYMCDTANYVFGSPLGDTVLFAYQCLNSLNSALSGFTPNTTNSIHSDTALYAPVGNLASWMITGNSLTDSNKYIGTSDSSHLSLKSNTVNGLLVSNNGNILINNPQNSAQINLLGLDGIVSSGTFGSSTLYNSTSGTKLIWYSGKGSFRAGDASSNQWDTANIGSYSVSGGADTKARKYSFSSGLSSEAIDNSLAIGRKCQANGAGDYPFGNTISIGDSCITNSVRSVAIGRKNVVTIPGGGTTGIAFGYNNFVSASGGLCLGSNSISSGYCSVSLGNFASSNGFAGSFVFSDASSTIYTIPNVARQFIVRASGGVIFYTDTLTQMGVSILPGDNSWSSVSDKNKKQNFKNIDYETMLLKIEKLKISSWNYKSQTKAIRHIGPMAQDFHKLFSVGENNISITTIDEDGVILSGIKALNNRIESLQNMNEIDKLKSEVIQLDKTNEFNKRLDLIEASLKKK